MSRKSSFSIKQGDTRPSFEYHLTRGSEPIDLRDADSIRFRIANLDGSELYVNGEATPTTPSDGQVRYTLSEGESLPVGNHHAEFEIFWGGGATETVPKSGYIRIEVNEPLGQLDPTDISDPDVTVTTVTTDNIVANSGSTVSVQNTLDLGGNSLDNVDSVTSSDGNLQINSDGSGTGSITLRDTANGTDILRADEGGEVDISTGGLTTAEDLTAGTDIQLGAESTNPLIQFTQNGNSTFRIQDFGGHLGTYRNTANGPVKVLEISDTGTISVTDGDLSLSTNQLTDVAQIVGDNGAGINWTTSGGEILTEGGEWVVYDTTNAQEITRFTEGGDVVLPSGNLDMDGNMIDNLTNIRQAAGDNLVINLTGTSTTDRFTVYDNVNGDQILSAYQGGNVEIPSGTATIGGDVVINGDNMIDLSLATGYTGSGLHLSDGNAVSTYNAYGTLYTYSGTGGGGWRIRNPDGAGDIFRIEADASWHLLEGNIEVTGEAVGHGGLTTNDRLQMNSNRIINNVGTEYNPVTEPAAPADGWEIYVDSADGALKAKADTGTIVTLATK